MKYKNNKGFTLVELIVVLVILAILAAIIIPALLGYIDEAKKKQDILDAKNLLMATQSEMAKEYARTDFSINTSNKRSILESYTNITSVNNNDTNNFDKNIMNSSFASNVFKLADCDSNRPNLFVVGTGDYNTYINGDSRKPADKDNHKPYTVYFAIYRRTKDSDIIYYDGNNWIYIPPLIDQGKVNAWGNGINGTTEVGRNLITVGRENIYLQYYIFSNNNGNKKWYDVYREDYRAKNNISR